MDSLVFKEVPISDSVKNTSTFQNNIKLPIHRWYRYTAGFSAAWVGNELEIAKKEGCKNVLDPFVGSGTVAVESMFHNMNAIGVESHPYVYKIAQAKIAWKEIPINILIRYCHQCLKKAESYNDCCLEYPDIVRKCFPEESLKALSALKLACLEIKDDKIKNFVWFVITSILRSTSPVGTAQWQYVLPNKSKAKYLHPFEAFRRKIFEIEEDIIYSLRKISSSSVQIFNIDARNMSTIPEKWADLVITSPPYANNYDYADAMRLEMSFWGDIKAYGELKEKVGGSLIRACTQHVADLREKSEILLNDTKLSCIKDELYTKFNLLHVEREKHGGKKNYHLMILAYFYDMAEVFYQLSRVTSDSAKMCFVIGDSAPYGIYIPVDEWIGTLAIAAGFKSYSFEKIRDRNIKWKNRKHQVPLKEGRLWIRK